MHQMKCLYAVGFYLLLQCFEADNTGQSYVGNWSFLRLKQYAGPVLLCIFEAAGPGRLKTPSFARNREKNMSRNVASAAMVRFSGWQNVLWNK